VIPKGRRRFFVHNYSESNDAMFCSCHPDRSRNRRSGGIPCIH